MPIPSLSGLVWRSAWASYGEGPYSLIAKMIVSNSIDISYFFRLDYHQRTGINLITVTSEPPNAGDLWRNLFWSSSLAMRCPTLHPHISEYLRLRYCPLCIDLGFHAAVSQISAITECPIHQCRLISNCKHCDRRIGYRADRDSIPGFLCPKCGMSLGLIGRRDSLKIWESPMHPSFREIDAWLEKIESELDFINLKNWSTCKPYDSYGGGQQIAVMNILQKLENINIIGTAAIDVLISKVLLIDLKRDDFEMGIDEYIFIMSELLPPVDWKYYWRYFDDLSTTISISMYAEVPPHVHAIIIWRTQFEKMTPFRQPRGTLPHFVPSSVTSLMETTFGYSRSRTTSRFLRRAVLHAAWTASVRIAENWHRLILLNSRGIEKPRCFWTETINSWLPLLSRWCGCGVTPIGIVFDRSESERSETAIRFFFA